MNSLLLLRMERGGKRKENIRGRTRSIIILNRVPQMLSCIGIKKRATASVTRQGNLMLAGIILVLEKEESIRVHLKILARIGIIEVTKGGAGL